MNEQLQLVRRQVRMVWPYRWVSLCLAALICAGGWFYVLFLPSEYEVTAKIFIDTRSMLRPLMRGLAVDHNNLSNTAMLMKRTLLTRPNLEEVARKTDLDLQVETEEEFDKLVESLGEKIRMTGRAEDNIYQIRFENEDPNLAKRVVDELLNEFLETALGSSRVDTATTQKFLDEQVAEYEKRLIEAEQRLKEFKQRNYGVMPGDGRNYYTRLEQARVQLDEASLQLREAQNRRNAMKGQLEGEVPMLGLMPGAGPGGQIATQYDARIDGLNGRLDELSLQYTDKHPEVISIRQTLKLLEEKQQEEIRQLLEAQANSPMPADASPEAIVFREMQLSIGQVEAEIAALSTRVQAYKEKVENLEKAIDTIPEVEAELKRLDRDYELNRNQYQELIERRESARLSEEVDEQADDAKLKVIEPPRVPLFPVGPKRVPMLTAVLGFGLGAGAALAFLLGQINPRFNSAEELKELTQLPIIGVVSMVFNRSQKTERRMELAVFSTVLVGLLAVFGTLVGLESAHYDLNGKVTAVVEAVL